MCGSESLPFSIVAFAMLAGLVSAAASGVSDDIAFTRTSAEQLWPPPSSCSFPAFLAGNLLKNRQSAKDGFEQVIGSAWLPAGNGLGQIFSTK
jgi:hypothetical protein